TTLVARRRGWIVLCLLAGRGWSWLPDLDDLRHRAGAARHAGSGNGMGAWSYVFELRLRAPASDFKEWPAGGDGHDRETGRVRCACQHHTRRSDGRRLLGRGVPAHRAQVVLLGSDVRRLPGAGAGAGRIIVLPASSRLPGRLLKDQPLMRNVVADLALESEAATTVMLRVARAYDLAGSNEREAAFRRLATAVTKYWVCKRTPMVTAEAVECLGGNGYVEESITPRLYREAPLNSIWEGSGNVIALDALRAMKREPESVEAFRGELARAAGMDAAYDAGLRALEDDLMKGKSAEGDARRLIESMV